MSTRLVEIFLPEAGIARLEEILPHHCRRFWRETVLGGQENTAAWSSKDKPNGYWET
jgi:hypothetical protein